MQGSESKDSDGINKSEAKSISEVVCTVWNFSAVCCENSRCIAIINWNSEANWASINQMDYDLYVTQFLFT